MKVIHSTKPLVFTEDGSVVSVYYDNEGDPFREGVSISFDNETYPLHARVLLDARDVQLLIAKLREFSGDQP